MRVEIVYNTDWLMSRQGDAVYPVDNIMNLIKEEFKVTRASSGDSSMIVILDNPDSLTKVEFERLISELINAEYNLSNINSAFEIEAVDTDTGCNEDGRDIFFDEKYDNAAEIEEYSKPDGRVMDKINSLVGANEFKALCGKINRISDGLKKNNLKDVLIERAYVMSIDRGCGRTRCPELFGELLVELELLNVRVADIHEIKIVAPQKFDDEDELLDRLKKLLTESRSKIMCLDIADWLGKLSEPVFVDMLDLVEKYHTDKILFFVVPFVEKDVLRRVELAINDRFCVEALSIPPFDNTQLHLLAKNFLESREFTILNDAWNAFDARVALEKSDGRFYGVKTVKKIVQEMLYLKMLSNAERGKDDKVIKAADVNLLIDGVTLDEKTALEELDELIGVDEVRRQLLEIVAQIEYAHRDKSVKPPCIHMRFVGNPGTGKTTIARILGKMLKEKGILRNGNFFEVFSRDLCGQYIGSTAPKTAAACRDAYGSVLFIDEAYALYVKDSERDFGREAINTLIAQMENHRSDFVVIMAGYSDKMEELMKYNQGLRSRMPYLIEFPNYTRGQMFDIFMKMAENFSYDDSFKNAAERFFSNLPDELMDSKEFSNARFARNLYERVWGKALLRCQMEGGEVKNLTVEDFEAASADKEFINESKAQKRKVGF